MIYVGTSLSDGGFVSSGVTQVASALGISVDGSALISRPASGTFTYNGSSTIYGASNDLGESGTMNVVADFGNKTASLTLITATGFATANNLSINLTTGSLDGHGLIGQTGISSDAATIKGYFAGRSAEGVYGTVFQKVDVTNSKAATFYGTK